MRRHLALVPFLALCLTLFAGFHLLAHGYRFGVTEDTHSIHLPILRDIMEPALFPNDPMIATRASYPSFYFHLLALIANWVPIPTLFLAIHLTTLLAYLGAVVALTLRLAPDPQPARPVLAALLLTLASLPILAGDDLILRAALPRHLGMALALWALYAGLVERRLFAFLLAGLTVNLHALSGLFALVILVGGDLARFSWRRWAAPLLAAAAGCLIALPTLLWSWSVRTPITPAWIELLRLRSSQHSFPLSWPLTDYLMLALWLGLALAGQRSPRQTGAGRWLAGAAGALCLLGLIGFVFAEIWPLDVVLRGQFLRSAKFLTLLTLPLIARWLLYAWDCGGVARYAALLTTAALFIPDPLGWIGGVLLGVLLFAARDWQPLARLAPPLPNPLPTWPPAVRWFLAVAGIALLISGTAFLLRPRIPPDLLAAWRDVQQWAQQNTPAAAVFVTPPYYYGFRIESERPIVGEWKDGTQQYFSVPFTAVWWERMNDLHAAAAADIRYNDLTAAEVRALAQKYSASFAIFFTDKTFTDSVDAAPFAVVYRNRWFQVLQTAPLPAP